MLWVRWSRISRSEGPRRKRPSPRGYPLKSAVLPGVRVCSIRISGASAGLALEDSVTRDNAGKFAELTEVLDFRDFRPYRRQRLNDRITLMGFENLNGQSEIVVSTRKRPGEPPP